MNATEIGRAASPKAAEYQNFPEHPWEDRPAGRHSTVMFAALKVEQYAEAAKQGGLDVDPTRAIYVAETDMETHEVVIHFDKPVDSTDIQGVHNTPLEITYTRDPKREFQGRLLTKEITSYRFQPGETARGRSSDLWHLRKVMRRARPHFFGLAKAS